MNENLKMSSALLSRFDLVFILLDRPDEHMDKRLSEHIMAVSIYICAVVFTSVIIVLYSLDHWYLYTA